MLHIHVMIISSLLEMLYFHVKLIHNGLEGLQSANVCIYIRHLFVLVTPVCKYLICLFSGPQNFTCHVAHTCFQFCDHIFKHKSQCQIRLLLFTYEYKVKSAL